MVEADLAKKYSPEQIAGGLKVEFPDQPDSPGAQSLQVPSSVEAGHGDVDTDPGDFEWD
jgi:hypothetical protein